MWIILAVISPLAVAGVWLMRPRTEVSAPSPTVMPLTTMAGFERQPAFSPDGNQVAYVWNGEKQDSQDIYVQVIGSGLPLRLTTDPAPDYYPAWSPDGRQIAFSRADSVYLISPLGGPERKLADVPSVADVPGGVASSMSWSPDGKWLAVAQRSLPS